MLASYFYEDVMDGGTVVEQGKEKERGRSRDKLSLHKLFSSQGNIYHDVAYIVAYSMNRLQTKSSFATNNR